MMYQNRRRGQTLNERLQLVGGCIEYSTRTEGEARRSCPQEAALKTISEYQARLEQNTLDQNICKTRINQNKSRLQEAAWKARTEDQPRLEQKALACCRLHGRLDQKTKAQTRTNGSSLQEAAWKSRSGDYSLDQNKRLQLVGCMEDQNRRLQPRLEQRLAQAASRDW